MPFLRRVPELLGDDTQIRDWGNRPVALRIGARHALPCGRILDVGLPVPDLAPDIELIVQDPGAALPVAINGRGPPVLARGGRVAFFVQGLCNLSGGNASCVVLEDATDRGGFFRDNLAIPAPESPIGTKRLDGGISIALASGPRNSLQPECQQWRHHQYRRSLRRGRHRDGFCGRCWQ